MKQNMIFQKIAKIQENKDHASFLRPLKTNYFRMKTIRIILSVVGMFGILCGCSEDFNQPIEKNSNAPGKISVTNIENLPGSAVLTYTLPNDPDLLYVMATYIQNGTVREFKASYYTNTIKLEGFGREADYQVDLFAVNRSEKRSEIISVTVRPTRPPVMEVYETMQYKATFGGVTLSYENKSGAFIAVGVLTANSEGELYEPYTSYSNRPEVKFSVRGFETQERKFGIYARDKWGNSTDTSYFSITPLYEMPLDKSLFKELRLPGDADPTAWGGQLRYIWDGRAFGDNEGEWGLHTGNVATGKPTYVSFDLGQEAILSRFKLWVIMDDKHMYNDVSPRRYEVWGRSEQINPTTDNGDFYPNWFKMCEIENSKPSGLPQGTLTDEDRTAARAGDEYVFEETQFNVRYIRIVSNLNWNGNTNMCFSEVSFWATEIKPVNN